MCMNERFSNVSTDGAPQGIWLFFTRTIRTDPTYNGSGRDFLAHESMRAVNAQRVWAQQFKDALTYACRRKNKQTKKLLTVRSIFLQMDFDLLQSQPSVLVHTEVV